MMREPKTEPMPAPDPATPTVAAPIEQTSVKEIFKEFLVRTGVKKEALWKVSLLPAPMNLAAESMSDLGAEVERRWEAWKSTGLVNSTQRDIMGK